MAAAREFKNSPEFTNSGSRQPVMKTALAENQNQSVNKNSKKTKPLLQMLMRAAGLRLVLTILLSSAIVATGTYGIRLLENNLRESKERDVWALLFLNLEKQAQIVANNLIPQVDFGRQKSLFGAPLSWDGTKDKKYKGFVAYALKANGDLDPLVNDSTPKRLIKNFGLSETNGFVRWNVLKSFGKYYLAYYSATQNLKEGIGFVAVKPLGANPGFKLAATDDIASRIYMVSKQGELLFSNNEEITQETIRDRALVQKFISLPVLQAQLDLVDANGAGHYGYFHEVPQTNLVVFAETPKAEVQKAVKAIVRRTTRLLWFALALSALIIQIPLFLVLQPVRSLATAAESIGQGKFAIDLPKIAFGELHALSETFRRMAHNLMQRDRDILRLQHERESKIRLEREMSVARGIQDGLLPSLELDAKSGVSIAAIYKPASEVAGDWYGFEYEPITGDTVVCIADINGHGAGSSMFTAVCASAFDQAMRHYGERKSVEEFFETFNRQLLKFGHNHWAATAQVVIFNATKTDITLINAGHPSPVIQRAGEPKTAEIVKNTASALLGVEDSPKLCIKKLSLGAGETIYLYSDGLIERTRKEGGQFGKKRLMKLAEQVDETALDLSVSKLVRLWDEQCGGTVQEDDLCVVAIRRLG